MGHYCRICGRIRANEKFSGKGHKTHLRKNCARRPKVERDAIDQQEEIHNFLYQSHISDKNMTRLQTLKASDNAETAELAAIVFAVAQVRPYKKRRLKILARQRQDLLQALQRTGLIYDYDE